ncbi:MAG: aldo/keto reductase [Acholeplasmataceae bacterium]
MIELMKLSNGVLMPQLGIGTFLVADGKTAYDTVKYALEVGYRLIDTAQMYKNEESIGQAIKDSNIDRKDIFITTKQARTGSISYMEKQLNASLKALQTDYVDLYLIHWPNGDKNINQDTWRFFEKIYEAGKAKAIGISNFQKHMIEDILEIATIKPMVNQVECHPGLTQVPLKAYLDAMHIQMESYGPFMRGGVFNEPYKETLEEIAIKHNATIAQIVIAWGLHRQMIMIPKSITPSRILQNFKAQYIKLSEEEVQMITDLNRGQRLYTDPDNSPWGAYIK